MARTVWMLAALGALVCGVPAQAQDAPQAQQEREREAALFGEPEPAAPAQDAKTPNTKPGGDAERDAAIFGDPSEPAEVKPAVAPSPAPATRDDALLGDGAQGSGIGRLTDLQEKIRAADRELAIGGFTFLQLSTRLLEDTALADQPLSAPNLLDLFLDARPNPDVRAFVRARVLYDYTVQDGASASALSAPSLGTGTLNGSLTGARASTRVQLDQLWLKFHVKHAVFITIGRQRVRWGVSRFWNPTDFLNDSQINPIALFDQRLGVDLLKIHVPIPSANMNLYAVGMLGQASAFDGLGGALRLEALLGTTEISASFAARKRRVNGPTALPPVYAPTLEWPQESTPLRFGLDVSTAIWDLDVRAEAALTHRLADPFYRGSFDINSERPLQSAFPEDYSRKEDWIVQVVLGAEWLIKLGDDDLLGLTAEYFYNGAGYADDELYLWLALQGSLRPLYLGRHYAALGVALPGPGSWNDTTFTLSGLANLSDQSTLVRLDYVVRFLSDLSFNAYVMAHPGRYGELRFRAEIPPLPIDESLSEGLVIPASWLDLGVGLRMSF